jgi:hypothetical protein
MRQFIFFLIALASGPAFGQPADGGVAPEARSAQVSDARIEPDSNTVVVFGGAARASGLPDWTLDLIENLRGGAVHLRYTDPNSPAFCEATIGRVEARSQDEANAGVHYLFESMSQGLSPQRVAWRSYESREIVQFFHSVVYPDGRQAYFNSSVEALYAFPDDVGREAVVVNKFCFTPIRLVVVPTEFRRFQISLSAPER